MRTRNAITTRTGCAAEKKARHIALVLVCLGLAPGVALAKDLYCTGEVSAGEATAIAARTFRLFEGAGEFETAEGFASGPIQTSDRLYMGMLATPDGHKFWINLDRYSGALIVLPVLADGTYGVADFNGSCVAAERRF